MASLAEPQFWHSPCDIFFGDPQKDNGDLHEEPKLKLIGTIWNWWEDESPFVQIQLATFFSPSSLAPLSFPMFF